MAREEDEQRKRLEKQFQEAIELLKAGFHQQLRALELVWRTIAEGDELLPRAPAGVIQEEPAAAVPASAAPQPAEPSRARQKRGQLWTDIDAVLDDLPDVFNRHDLVKALGYEPDPSALHRVIHGLLRRGVIVIKYRSHGKIPAVYEFVVEEEEDDAAAAAEVGEEKLPAS